MKGNARRGVIYVVASALMPLWLGTMAAAQSSKLKNIELCNGVDRPSPEAQMSGCTALIEANLQGGRDKPRLLAVAHNNRGK